MKVVVATAFDRGYAEMAEITLPSLKAYCEKHGYELWIDDDIPPTEKDACKARIYQELKASGNYGKYDLFMWIDTDALVMNSEIDVPALWAAWANGSRHFLWAYDFNGPNSGVWIARFSDEAAHFIRVYAATAAAMGWGDNEAMNQKSLQPPFDLWVRCIPGKAMNAYPYAEHGLTGWSHRNEVNSYEPGDWILHAAGIESKRRLELLREYARLAK
jgi:hypothetical protein